MCTRKAQLTPARITASWKKMQTPFCSKPGHCRCIAYEALHVWHRPQSSALDLLLGCALPAPVLQAVARGEGLLEASCRQVTLAVCADLADGQPVLDRGVACRTSSLLSRKGCFRLRSCNWVKPQGPMSLLSLFATVNYWVQGQSEGRYPPDQLPAQRWSGRVQ